MSPLQIAIAHGVKVALLLTLAGLVYRRRLRLCWSMALYLVVILTCNALITMYPARFYTRSFYIQKSAVYDILLLCVSVELTWRVFRAFQGARRSAALILFAVTVVALLIVRLPVGLSYEATIYAYRPRTLSATIWILSAAACTATYYSLPIHAWHRAALVGLSAYLLVFTTLLNVLRDFGWNLREHVALVDAVCYLALITWWAWTAWRPAETIVVPPHVAARLRLETA